MHSLVNLALLLALQQTAAIRNPASNGQSVLAVDDEDLVFHDSAYYYGISTFANTPYVNCFVAEEAKKKRYDIAVLGAPHDTVSRLAHQL